MIKKILNHIKVQRNIDLSGYEDNFIREQVENRIIEIKAKSYCDYLSKINSNQLELEKLIERISNNTSLFFRKPLLYEYLYNVILPAIIKRKKQRGESSLRIWSAGCSQGQEPYTMAIIINELLQNKNDFYIDIFASDINDENLKKAKTATYSYESIKNIKYNYIKKYFTQSDDYFKLNPLLKEKVRFSNFDLMDLKHSAPPDSIFGNFDIVLCCNVLMYYKDPFKDIIFKKLLKNIAQNGYLILGDSEKPYGEYSTLFSKPLKNVDLYKKL